MDPPFDLFVEKMVRHNQLVPLEKLDAVKARLASESGTSLLQALVQGELLHPRHGAQIESRYKAWMEKCKPAQPVVEKPVPEPARQKEPEPSNPSPWEASTQKETPTLSPPAQPIEAPAEPLLVHETAPAVLEGFSLAALLAEAASRQASDLHLSPGSPPMLRIHGAVTPLGEAALDTGQVAHLLMGTLDPDQKGNAEKRGSLDASLVVDGRRLRFSMVRQQLGWDGVYRLVPEAPPTFESMDFPEAIRRLTSYREGLVLVTGPSGAGKSTTLSALVDHINRTRPDHIIMMEDPIETVFPMHRSHISQRAVGLHTQSYAHALRAALREDPDVIVVGELRDRETTQLAVSAAETGHLVFATLHTTSAGQTLYRLLDFFPPDQRNQVRAMISESLRGILCQRLVPRADGQGRVLAMEILLNVPAIANIIREDRIYQLPNMIQINQHSGMRLLDEALEALVDEEVIPGAEAYFAANQRQRFADFAPRLDLHAGADHGQD